MCTNAAKTAGNLMAAEEPTLVSLLTESGLVNTPDGISAVTAYNAAEAALESWKSGTDAQNILELIGAAQSIITVLPIPPLYATLVNLVLGGIAAAVGIITANSPAPAPTAADGAVTPQITAAAQTFHAHAVGANTEATVEALAGVKVSFWDKARAAAGDTNVAAGRYKSEWNKAVDTGGFDQTLKVA